MKRIYTFLVESSGEISDVFRSNVSLLAELVINDIKDYEFDVEASVLVYNKYLKLNDLIDSVSDTGYKYSYKNNNNLFTNPFIYNDGNSFAITVYDGMINIGMLEEIVNVNQRLIGTNYNVSIGSIDYKSNSLDDESKRQRAISSFVTSSRSLTKRRLAFIPNLVKAFGR